MEIAIVLFFVGVALIALIAGIFFVLVTVVKGISRLRFSLRSMMIVVLCGGVCVTMMMDKADPGVSLLGFAFSLVYFMVTSTYILALGSETPESKMSKVPENRGTV